MPKDAATGRTDAPGAAMGFEVPLWRGIAVFRTAALVHAVALMLQHLGRMDHPALAWAVIVVMAAWTAVAGYAYARPALRGWPLPAADLGVAFACMLSTGVVGGAGYLDAAPPLTATWFAAAPLSAAVLGGRRWAVGAALGYGVADLLLRGEFGAAVLNGVVLLLLAGYAVGYMAHIAAESERRFARAVELEARTRERERLARSIHDSVLQVLAMVQRRGTELGGEAAELGRLAGEQEAALRGLVGRDRPAGDGVDPPPGTDRTDLCGPLAALGSATVTVSTPATEVPVPALLAAEVEAAVRAALANVDRHCPPGTRSWILVEDEGDTVTVTVRDDGPGMPAGRVEQAAADGRLGIAQSITGRIRDLGGEVAISTAPGEGTEIEMRVPR
ncbi:MacS family sensor histidine kinase [Marinactinospora rubrisoli]|uniref:MacS family sensor histidine kinase n=1 Tax=Marinactinospora rubrisoli TaxID=2715399 RepID=A0ABW2KMJ0_9ACTN